MYRKELREISCADATVVNDLATNNHTGLRFRFDYIYSLYWISQGFFSKVTIKLLTYCNKPTTVDGTSTSITDLCHSLFTFYSHLPIISTLLNIACFFFLFTFSGQQTQSSYLSADWRGSGRGVWGTFGISHRIKGRSSHSPWGRSVGIFWWKILQEKTRRSY